jgi:hypothetical protein
MGLESLYEERGNPFDPGGGCGTLDGLPISCSELRMRMQGGSVGVEIEVPVSPRVVYPQPTPIAPYYPLHLTVFRYPIISLGVGLHVTWVPTIRDHKEGYYLDVAEEVFEEPQESAMAIAQRKNCATPNSIVEQYKLEFEAQWNRTLRTGEENGSLVFYEHAANTYFRLSLSEGRHLTDRISTDPAMPESRGETRRALDYFRREGRNLYFLAFFHTHPNSPHTGKSSTGPSGDDIQFQSDFGNALGILRTGTGYSFFSNGRTFRPDDARANECIWSLNKQRG